MKLEAIYREIDRLREIGLFRSEPMIYSPDGRRRFVIEAVGFRGERSYSRSEFEAFLHGADAMRTALTKEAA